MGRAPVIRRNHHSLDATAAAERILIWFALMTRDLEEGRQP
jgi:hypothetical protein